MKRQYKSFDFLLVLLVCAISIFGIIVIGSASHINIGDMTDNYSQTQRLWFIVGLFFMLAAAFIDYHFICNFYILAYVLNLVLLILVFFLGNQDGTNTARWIRFGGAGIQPSELSKILIIIFMARFIDKYQEKINKLPVLLGTMMLIAVPVALIAMQPSLSAALVVLVVSAIILFAGNLSYKYIATALAVFIPAMVIFYIDIQRTSYLIIDKIFTPYQLGRIKLFLYPDISDPKYYQTGRSIEVIGSGTLHGKGLYQGLINEINYVPYAHNDFVFAVVGEEFGFIGSVILITAMLLIIIRCIYIAHKAADLTGRLIAVGVASMFAFQTFVNVGVATGIVPNTGMAFPFVSYGGSSMLVSMISIGLCLNVFMSKPKSIFEG